MTWRSERLGWVSIGAALGSLATLAAGLLLVWTHRLEVGGPAFFGTLAVAIGSALVAVGCGLKSSRTGPGAAGLVLSLLELCFDGGVVLLGLLAEWALSALH